MGFGRVPGVHAGQQSAHRSVVLKDGLYLPNGVIVDGALSRDPANTLDVRTLRAGTILGKVTATGKYAPTIIGLVTADYTSGGTELTVSAATAAELVRRVGASGTFDLTHAPTPTGTVVPRAQVTYSAVNTSTGVITISDIGANVETGAILHGDDDGSEVPLCIVPDGTGIDVVDFKLNTNIDARLAMPLVGGFIRTANIVNYPAAANTTLIAWLKAQLRLTGGWYIFDDDF